MAADPEQRPARRVLHLIDSYGLGGAQTVLRDYLEASDSPERKFAYALRSVPDPLIADGATTWSDASGQKYSFKPLHRLRQIIQEHRIEVLHCHLFRSQVFGYLLKTRSFPQIALIFHEHGRVVGREAESRAEAWVFRMFMRVASRSVDAYLCNSAATQHHLRRLLGANALRVAVVPNPIRQSYMSGPRPGREQARRAMGVPEGAFAVGFAGRLVETKGWRDFLAAVAMAKPRVRIFFLIAGDGGDRERARVLLSELGLSGDGRLLGFVSRMESFYPALDCLVMPSHWESHGLSQLEAQHFGIPVIVSDVPGLAQTVHPDVDALLAPARDPAALAERIQRLAADETLRARLAHAGPANAERYSMQSFSSALTYLYRDLPAAASPV